MSQNKIYLITGANRGIGRGLTASLLQRPSTTVVAAVRDPAKAKEALESLPRGQDSKIIVIKLDSGVDSDASVAVSRLQKDFGISALDVVIANAGIANDGNTVLNTSPESIRDHFNVNTIAPISLLQATQPLLKKAQSGNPIFVAMSTAISSIGFQEKLAHFPPRFSPYGASKSALNWLIRRVHIEEPWLTAFVFHPGLVLTDMGTGLVNAAKDPSKTGAITVDVSVNGILKTLDSASREISGTFQNYDGSFQFPW
ncbi:unnamed protein product [Clonostachys rosea f. rosea IK726]|uniref:Uncharacterized protein n=2 Tax=Bionectria ochroleuca TaxID=29856 RepID=A0A0B7K6S4_BIOOC|nr:unnamed protein product [Clonostachys rosea f. rosea IK726]